MGKTGPKQPQLLPKPSSVSTPSIPSVLTISAHAPGQPQVIMEQYVQQPGSSNMMILTPGVQTVQAAPSLVPVNGLGAGQFTINRIYSTKPVQVILKVGKSSYTCESDAASQGQN